MIAKSTPSRSLLSPRRLFVSVGSLVSLIALVALAGCGSGTAANSGPAATATTAPAAATATTAPTATSAAAANATMVKIAGAGTYSFQPASVTIKVGDTVTWTNVSGVAHTSTSDTNDAVSWDSSVISSGGGTFSFTFTKAGTFTYHCSFHPYMHGTVVVTS